MGPAIALVSGLAGAASGAASAATATSALATAASLLGAGASLLSGIGGYMQAEAAAAQAEIEAEQRREQAREAVRLASEREAQLRRRARLMLAEQRAALAQRGLLASPSALDMLRVSIEEAERDAVALRRQGWMRALGYYRDADAIAQRAAPLRIGGAMSLAEGLFGAGSTLGRWYASRRPGFGPPRGGSGLRLGGR